MRKGEVEVIKAMVSRQIDTCRVAYGRTVSDFPRQFILIGTTNADRFLRDATGNRRFWPVAVGKFDLDALMRDRDQLMAEAVHRVKAGCDLTLPRELYPDAVAAQREREQIVSDPWYEVLEPLLGDLEGKVRAECLWRALGSEDASRRSQADRERLGAIMRRLGFEPRKQRFAGEKNPLWGYVRGADDGRGRRREIELDGTSSAHYASDGYEAPLDKLPAVAA